MGIGAEVGTVCGNLAAGIFLARAVGADGKGIFTVAMTVAAVASAVLGMRWDRPVGHFLAKESSALPTIVTSVAVVAGVAMGLTGLVLSLGPPRLSEILLRGVDRSVVQLVPWLVGAQCVYVGIAALYGGLRDFAGRSRFILTYNVLQGITIGTVYLAGVREVVTYLRWYAATSWMLEMSWLTALGWRYRVRPRWEGRLIRRMAGFGSLSYFALLLDLVTVRLDIIMLNYMSSAAAVGVYSVAVSIGARLASVPQIIGYVVFHRASARELGSGARTAQLLRMAALVITGSGLVVALAGTLLVVPLYGSGFAGAVPALWIMIPAMCVWGLYRLLASDIEGRGRPGLVSMSSLIANATIVTLDVLWIPRYGILGAAWASLIAYVVALAVAALMFCRVTGLRARDAYCYRSDDLGTMSRIATRLARRTGLAGQPG